MPYAVYWNDEELLLRFTGSISADQIADAVRWAQAQPQTAGIKYVLNDFSECAVIGLADSAIGRLAASDRSMSRTMPTLKIALYPDRLDVRALAAAYEGSAMSHWPIRVCDSEESARKWAAEHCSCV